MVEIPRRRRRQEQWILDVILRDGRALGEQDGVYRFQLEDPLKTQIGRETLALTFQKKLASKEDVELASHGSWLHDQLLRYAHTWGQGARFFFKPEPDLDLELLMQRRRIDETLDVVEKVTYGTLLEYIFRVSYYTEPPRERLLSFVYDANQGKVVKRAYTKSMMAKASSSPENEYEYEVPEEVPFQKGFDRVWIRVEKEIAAEVEELKKGNRVHLERELRVLEDYYRQLLDEEKRLLGTRLSRKSREETQRRMEMLKLDWERRVKEETERLKPQVIGELRAVAVIHSPLEAWRTAEGGRVWVDRGRGEVWRGALNGHGSR